MKLVNIVLVLLLVSAWHSYRVLADDEMLKQAQQELLKRDFKPGSVDGVMGPRTRRALTNFQETYGLTPSGQLDEPTKQRLGLVSTPTAPQPEAGPEQLVPAPPDTELQPIPPPAPRAESKPSRTVFGTEAADPAPLRTAADVTKRVGEAHVEIEYHGHSYRIPRVFVEPSVQLSDTLRFVIEPHSREPESAEQTTIDNAGSNVSPNSDASEARSSSGQNVGSEDTNDAPVSSVSDNADGDTWLGESLISGWTNLELLLMVLLSTFALASLVLCVRLLFILPRRRRERLWEAFAIIERDQTERFEQAEDALEHSVGAGLTQTEIDEARFALAYLRARTNKLDGAAADVGTLARSEDHSRETLYLNLWIKLRRGEHENVVRFYTEHADVLKDVLQARLIAGIAYLDMARCLWKRQEFAQSMAYYERLRRLDVLQDEIPTRIDDHQITVAIQALYLNDEAKARKSFRNAIDAAKEDRSISKIKAKLGLLLCTWHAQKSPDVDDELGELLDDLDKITGVAIYATCSCPSCDHRYRVRTSYSGQIVRCQHCRGDFRVQLDLSEQEAVSVAEPKADGETDEPGMAGTDTQGESADSPEAELEHSEAEPGETSAADMDNEIEGDPLLNEDDLLHRNVAFWYAISDLFTWRGLPSQEGLPHQHRDQLLQRIRRVTDVDPHFPDARLVQGLILYFFHRTPEELAQGFELIEQVTENDVTLAEVIALRDRHRRFLQARQDSLDRYSSLVEEWIANKDVPSEHRELLRQKLCGFERFQTLDNVVLELVDEAVAPSASDIGTRTALVRNRVGTIVRNNLAEADEKQVEEIQGHMQGFDSAAQTLQENVDKVQQAEANLLATTGEFLFGEEEGRREALTDGEQ